MLAAFLAATLAAAPPAARPAPPAAAQEQVRIPLARFRLRTFRPDGDDVAYLQDRQRNWYRAELAGPCYPLSTALRVGLDTHGSSTVDNTSSLIVDGESCRITSLVRSAGQPGRR